MITRPRLALRLGHGYRFAVTRLAWLVIAIWVAGAAAVTVLVEGHGAGGDDFADLLPSNSEVLETQQRSLELFRVPVVSGTTVVLHDPEGLTLLTRADSLVWALASTQRAQADPERNRPGRLLAAIPIPTGNPTVSVTFIYASPGTGVWPTVVLANQYAAHFNNQPVARTYVTGSLPAQIAQGDYLSARLPLFEGASVVLIITIVALAFRSVLAPLAVLAVAAVGYLIYFPLTGAIAEALGFSVPAQLEPVLLALLLGVVTDYCVLLFAAYREGLQLSPDRPSVELARRALRSTAGVIFVAGLTVAGGTAALLAAPFAIFRGLGPALALTVLIGLAVCLTLTPALMTVLGWRLFTVLPVRASRRRGFVRPRRAASRLRPRPPRVTSLTRNRTAWLATFGVIAALALAVAPLAFVRLDLSFTAALPASDQAAEGAQALADAGLEGLSAPTEVIVEAPGIATRRTELRALQQAIAREPGVARVLGPADSPLVEGQGLVLSTNGDAARFIVIYDTDPLAATAVGHARTLQADLPQLLDSAGLGQADAALTGQTMIAAEVADLTRESLAVVLVVAVLIELVILAIYLRALLAPIALLACSVLSVGSALGLTVLLFQGVLGDQGLTFYAPFASAVLLIALGSDYNVFVVGGVWAEAKRRPLRQAIIIAVPRTAHAITIAGAILAGTFALVGIIPLSTFRQIAFAMTVGLIIDTLVVRPILTPAVLTLLGRWSSWPSRLTRRFEDRPEVPR